jgi:hypothetical protein
MTTFSAEVRVLVCSNCGASLPPVDAHGGTVQCSFCRQSTYIGVRDDGSIASGAPVDEAQRMASLWQQVDVGFMVHPEVTQLGEQGVLTEHNVNAAREQWERIRAIAADPVQAPMVGDDLMWLTTLLAGFYAGQGDRERVRAFWESTLEASHGPRQRQFSRGSLCRLSVNDGDLTAAMQWLRPCDPQPSDLCSDSTYRLSYSFIATVQGQFDNVIQAVGQSAQDLPWFFSLRLLSTAVRANATEKRGDVAGAVDQLRKLAEAAPEAASVIPAICKANTALDLCPQSVPLAYG